MPRKTTSAPKSTQDTDLVYAYLWITATLRIGKKAPVMTVEHPEQDRARPS